jgi:hypothetical protein
MSRRWAGRKAAAVALLSCTVGCGLSSQTEPEPIQPDELPTELDGVRTPESSSD